MSLFSSSTPPAQLEQRGLFGRLKKALKRTRSDLVEGVARVFVGRKAIDEDLLEEIESLLLIADVGVASRLEGEGLLN